MRVVIKAEEYAGLRTRGELDNLALICLTWAEDRQATMCVRADGTWPAAEDAIEVIVTAPPAVLLDSRRPTPAKPEAAITREKIPMFQGAGPVRANGASGEARADRGVSVAHGSAGPAVAEEQVVIDITKDILGWGRCLRDRNEAAADEAELGSTPGQPAALDELIERARHHRMTAEECHAQRISFAHGNVALANPAVSRHLVEEVAREIAVDVSAEIENDEADDDNPASVPGF